MTNQPNRKTEGKRLPNAEPLKSIEDVKIPHSSTHIVDNKEQLKNGQEVKTEDKKDGTPDAHAYMRRSYYKADKSDEVYIPVKEMEKIMRKMHPESKVLASVDKSDRTQAHTTGKIYLKENQTSIPDAQDVGHVLKADLPFFLQKKLVQCAATNAVYRVMEGFGIPLTIGDLFLRIKMNEIPSDVLDYLNNDEEIFQTRWKQLEKETEKTIPSLQDIHDQANEFTLDDLDELPETLITLWINGQEFEQEIVIKSLRDELILHQSKSLAQELTLMLGDYKTQVLQIEDEPEPEIIEPYKSPSKKKTKKVFIARDKITGHVIKEFTNLDDASKFAEVAKNSISKALSPSAKNKSAGGYLWTKEQKKVGK